ncbi:hypothetical protein ACFYOC_25480 [Nocardiopsis alba]|uniref:hypothetical protein n=1 Tax=Nocardiopsis alba TaxID=53437 RepID=UPI00369AE171
MRTPATDPTAAMTPDADTITHVVTAAGLQYATGAHGILTAAWPHITRHVLGETAQLADDLAADAAADPGHTWSRTARRMHATSGAWIRGLVAELDDSAEGAS